MNKTPPRAVLLDFFGTVVEEIHSPVNEICRRISAAARPGLKINELVIYWARQFVDLCNQSSGANFRLQKELEVQSLQKALEIFEVPLDARPLAEALSRYRSHPVLFPESRYVLDMCSLPVCLVTNIDNMEIQSAVKNLGLHFDYIVTSEDCRAYKPDRMVFEKALARLNLPAEEVLHVGDSWHGDVQGARNLGIPVLWIDRHERAPGHTSGSPEYTAPDLTGLLDILG